MNALFIVMQLFIVLFAITIHEASHGWAANKMGDPTAYSLGRVSLNPIAHIDPIGTILLPVLLSLTGGPASNLLAASSAFLLLFILKLANPSANLFLKNLVGILRLKSGFLAPIMPQGFHLMEGLVLFLFMALIMNCYFAVFNLIPIPPLDGSGVLIGLLPDDLAQRYDRIRPFGFIIVIFLVYMGFLSLIIEPLKFLIFIFLG